MDKFLKTVMVIGLISAFALTVQFARAEGEVCENGGWTQQQEAFVATATVTQLNADQIASMVGKVGQPPRTVGDFDAFLVVNEPLAAVFIVQKGCTTDRLGPAPAETIYSLLGIVKASAPQGERVD